MTYYESRHTLSARNGSILGPWQISVRAHPWADPWRLTHSWWYSARAAYRISDGGRDWYSGWIKLRPTIPPGRAPMREHEHEWRKVAPVVVVVNDPLADAKGGQTFNARCSVCGLQEWLHWPSGSLAAAKPPR